MAPGEKKNPGGLSDEERLTQMGSDRLLADLRKKYRLGEQSGTPDETSGEGKPAEGFSVLRHMDDQSRAIREKVEGLPIERRILHKEDLRGVLQVKRQLDVMVSNASARLHGLDPKDKRYHEIAMETVGGILDYLNRQPVWSAKFSTEASGGGSGEIVTTPDDSIYYMTPAGISLRIRRASISDGYGLGKVVQPFMEMILFRKPVKEYDAAGSPVVGYSVRDYVSRGFEDLLARGSVDQDYASPIEAHVKDGLPYFVLQSDQVYEHTGDRVNHIFKM